MAYVDDYPGLKSGLMLYYRGGRSVEDVSGNQNHGFRVIESGLDNPMGFPSAAVGNPFTGSESYLFTIAGAGSYPSVTAGTTPMNPGSGAPDRWWLTSLSYSVWAFLKSPAPNWAQGSCLFLYQRNLAFGYSGNWTNQPLAFMLPAGVSWAVQDPTYVISSLTDQWVHYACTWDDTTKLATIYVNGAYRNSRTLSYSLAQPATTDHLYMFNFSGNADYDIFSYSKGTDGAIWNRALSAGEISTLYACKGYKDFTETRDNQKRYWTFTGSEYMQLTAANGSGEYNPASNFTIVAGVKLATVGPSTKHTIISKISPSEGGYELYVDNVTLKFRVYKNSVDYTETSIGTLTVNTYTQVWATFKKAFNLESNYGRVTVGYIANGVRRETVVTDAVGSVVTTAADFKIGAGTLGGNIRGNIYWAAYLPRVATQVEIERCNEEKEAHFHDAPTTEYYGGNAMYPGGYGGTLKEPAMPAEPTFNVPRLNPSMLVDFHQSVGATYSSELPILTPRAFDIVGVPTKGGLSTHCIDPDTQYWEFGGSGDYLSTPNNAILNPTGDFTLVWCGVIYGVASSTLGLIGKYTTTPTCGYSLYCYDASGTDSVRLAVSSTGSNVSILTSTKRRIPHRKILVTATYQYVGATNSIGTMYVNDSTADQITNMVGPVFTNTGDLTIGYEPFSSPRIPFEGKLYYTALFHRVLTQLEHRNLFHKKVWIEDLSPNFLFRADKPVATTVVSEIGSRTLTLTNPTGRVRLNGAPRESSEIASLYRLRKKPL